jgi:oxygen-independent coproporphyrinogen-3 oxidase
VAPLAEVPHERYLATVLAELARRAPEFAGRRLVSVYFGGGTPSLWHPHCVAGAVTAVCDIFRADPAALEITLEANPVDCHAERMAAWRAAGVTRLSIGVQSAQPRALVVLGRDHAMGDGLRALHAALEAGFSSLSADYILGIPGAGGEPLAGILEAVVAGAPHLSVYELTVEAGTPLAAAVRRGELAPEDDDTLVELYTAVHEMLEARGYCHYEVSSYARPGARAVHNSLYWRGAEYLGLGAGAASFWRDPAGGGRRWTNHRSVHRYLGAAPGDWAGEEEVLTAGEVEADLLWLGMRTSDGVDTSLFSGRPDLLDWLLTGALARPDGSRIRPTLRGFLHADQVARRVAHGQR